MPAPFHRPYTPQELDEIERLTKVANGTADHTHWNGDADEPPVNIYRESMGAADLAEVARYVEMAKNQK